MEASIAALTNDVAKKLMSFSQSLNADKATRLTQQNKQKDIEIETLKKKLREQQTIIAEYEEKWKLVKMEAIKGQHGGHTSK